MILAIDPGSEQSAYVTFMPDEFFLVGADIIRNDELLHRLKQYNARNVDFVIECIASYGMAVGKEVFETCYWIGRFMQRAEDLGFIVNRLYRKDEKINLCGSMKAKDSNITQALKDRLGQVGTSRNPGSLYGIKKDLWAALAVGITFYDIKQGLYKP